MSRNHFITTHVGRSTRHARPQAPPPMLEIEEVLPHATLSVAAPTRFRGALARQIRQDIWRALAGLRGLSPIVTVTQIDADGSEYLITVGLQTTSGSLPKLYVRGVVKSILSDPKHRQRWFRYAEMRAKC